MALAVRALLGLVLVVLLYRLARGVLGGRRGQFGGRRTGFPCGTCTNCGNVFPDGVICRFGGRETFKNEVHIANCADYRRRTG